MSNNDNDVVVYYTTLFVRDGRMLGLTIVSVCVCDGSHYRVLMIMIRFVMPCSFFSDHKNFL